jgi:hypothetical protein
MAATTLLVDKDGDDRAHSFHHMNTVLFTIRMQ